MSTTDPERDQTPPSDVPRWLTEQEQRTWRNFLFGARSLLRGIDRQLLRDSDLSGAEYDVLVPLSESPSGRMRSRDLLEFLGWERSRLSHLLTRMSRRGLVARLPCPDDARGLDVLITPKGTQAIESAAPAHLAMVRAVLMDELTDEEAAAINSINAKMTARLKELDLD
ncbi:MarR family transcriptional regulator [Kocuria sp. JC486]|uniref:MarR family transcriptional regulator n=1 Tax=Kocuria soli TaxID=2485125 RepID=A0A3N3ZTL8_9MICC|nr:MULTISPECIES: MarR family transcriptional regulator [Kocuria]NHU85069.1 MarR family transcriptional regulator [Kocuria sp. JC486]ROZ65657.1 MarR family transcriptional regulator [Kocuria soli]